MAVYPAHRSTLVIVPKNISSEDIALLTMEKNPMEVLNNFVSISDKDPNFQGDIYEGKNEDFISQNELDSAEGAVFAKFSVKDNQPKFLFFNLLKNTNWAGEVLGTTRESIVRYFADGKINGILSLSKKFVLVIPDEKFQNLAKERQKMTIPNTGSNGSVPSLSSRKNLHDKVMNVIKKGFVGGKGCSVTAEDLSNHLVNAYPAERWTRSRINGALATLLTHGELVRVPILDRNGNPTGSFAQAKYRIVNPTDADYGNNKPNVNNNPVVTQTAPVVAPVAPVAALDDLSLSTSGGRTSPKLVERVAIEDYIKNNMVDGHIIFNVEEICSKNSNLIKSKVTAALNNAKKSNYANNLIRGLGDGSWEYRNNENIPWSNHQAETAKSSNALTVKDLTKQVSILKKSLKSLEAMLAG
jgi:hypothetical protein